MHTLSALPAFELPALDSLVGGEYWYYGVSAVAFTFAGLICGYFIWRKGHMQMLEAENEVRRTSEDLKRLQEDLEAEENGLRE